MLTRAPGRRCGPHSCLWYVPRRKMAEVMKSSTSSSSLCLGAQPRDSWDTLQYQEAGRQEKVILWRKNKTILVI